MRTPNLLQPAKTPNQRKAASRLRKHRLLEVAVLAADFEQGDACSSTHCFLCVALMRLGVDVRMVGPTYCQIGTLMVDLPPLAVDALECFDADETVLPFTFSLNLSRAVSVDVFELEALQVLAGEHFPYEYCSDDDVQQEAEDVDPFGGDLRHEGGLPYELAWEPEWLAWEPEWLAAA